MRIGIRLAAALAGSVVVSVIATTVSNIWLTNHMVEQATQRELGVLDEIFDGRIVNEARRALSIANSLAQNTTVTKAFAARDRDALARMLVPGFARLKDSDGLVQMQFHTAPATSFLRVHAPQKFGDDLSKIRLTVLQVNQTGKSVFGLEYGVEGLGIRGVVPVMHDGQQIGSVEVGTSIGKPFLDQYKKTTNIESAIFLKGQTGFETFASTFASTPTVTPEQLAAALERKSEVVLMMIGGVEHAVMLAPVHDYKGTAIGVSMIGLDHSAYAAAQSEARNWALSIGAAMLVLTLGLAWLMHRNIAQPIQRIGEVLMALAQGDKNVEIPFTGRGDEIGDNARAAQTFRDNIEQVERLERERREAELRRETEQREAKAREAAERRDAAEREELAGKQAMHKLLGDFEGAVGSIIDLVSASATELEATAGALAANADSTRQLSTTVASASEEASANVQSVASATEQLTTSVNEISKQVHASSQIAEQAVNEAQKTDARVADLSQAASRIGDVVRLITAIAEQTNLLALNATIEAARAGEAGRGFAVVAQEVKALASQTAKATDEIGLQISGMQTATADSVMAIKAIGGTIGKISGIAGAIAAAVEEQGAATREIARNVEEAAKGTTQVSENISNVDRHASETGTAASEMLASAQRLSRESNHLKSEMVRFLDMVRTGLADRRRQDDPDYRGPERRKDRLEARCDAA